MIKILLLIIILGLGSCGYPEGFSRSFSKEMCSCLFVMKRDKDYCSTYAAQALKVRNYRVDDEQKTVFASFLGHKSESKFLTTRLGCQIQDKVN